MIDGCRTELNRQLNAERLPQLTRVHARAQTMRRARGEDRPRLVNAKRTGFAKHVNPSRKGSARLKHLPCNKLHVSCRIVCKLGRHNMRAQKCGFARQRCCEPQRATLMVGREPVAALDLHSGRALGAHLPHNP